MPAALYEFLVSLTYPPRLSLLLLALGVLVLLALRRWRPLGWAMVAMAVLWTGLWSVPVFSQTLRDSLEQR